MRRERREEMTSENRRAERKEAKKGRSHSVAMLQHSLLL